jgi:hypothetical protein
LHELYPSLRSVLSNGYKIPKIVSRELTLPHWARSVSADARHSFAGSCRLRDERASPCPQKSLPIPVVMPALTAAGRLCGACPGSVFHTNESGRCWAFTPGSAQSAESRACSAIAGLHGLLALTIERNDTLKVTSSLVPATISFASSAGGFDDSGELSASL